MEIQVPIPLDPDGFLRRECPACLREFKWLHSEDGELPEDGLVGCPYCRTRSEPDHFFTGDQAEYVTWAGGQEALRELSNSGWRVEPAPAPPLPTDLADMEKVAFGCHPDEPVKVYDAWADSQPVYCIRCGQER